MTRRVVEHHDPVFECAECRALAVCAERDGPWLDVGWQHQHGSILVDLEHDRAIAVGGARQAARRTDAGEESPAYAERIAGERERESRQLAPAAALENSRRAIDLAAANREELAIVAPLKRGRCRRQRETGGPYPLRNLPGHQFLAVLLQVHREFTPDGEDAPGGGGADRAASVDIEEDRSLGADRHRQPFPSASNDVRVMSTSACH